MMEEENVNPDDPWGNLEKRPFTDEENVIFEAESYLSTDMESPVAVARLFLLALEDVEENAVSLDQLVAPRTRPYWGDFTAAKQLVDGIPDLGVSTQPILFDAFPRVAQVKILNNVGSGFVVSTPQSVVIPAIVTLAFSPSQSMWLVYQLGQPLEPERVAPVD
jgi:hypothetical protein